MVAVLPALGSTRIRDGPVIVMPGFLAGDAAHRLRVALQPGHPDRIPIEVQAP